MLQFKRGTTAQVNAFIALEGQPLWNLDTHILTIGDGATPGGVSILGNSITVDSIVGLSPYMVGFLSTVADSISARSYLDAAATFHTHYLADLVDITPFGITLVQQPDAATVVALLSAASYADVFNLQSTVSVLSNNINDLSTYTQTISTGFVAYNIEQAATSLEQLSARTNITAVGYSGVITPGNLASFDSPTGVIDSGLDVASVSASLGAVSTKADKATQFYPLVLSSGSISDYTLQNFFVNEYPVWRSIVSPLAEVRMSVDVGTGWEATDATGVVVTVSTDGFPVLPWNAIWFGDSVDLSTTVQPASATFANEQFIENVVMPFLPTSVQYRRINVSSSRAFLASDHGAILNCTAGVTLTANFDLPPTFYCEVIQNSVSQVTFATGTRTFRNSFNFTKTRGQYAVATVRVIGSEMFSSGDMSN